MDKILEAVLGSDKPDLKKLGLVKQVKKAGSQNNTVESIRAIFEITVKIMIEWTDPLAIDAAKEIYRSWATFNRATLVEYLQPDVVYWLMNVTCRNPENISFILIHSFTMIAHSFPNRLPPLEHVVATKASRFVYYNSKSTSLIKFCSLLLEFKNCIPQHSETSKFCVAILHATTYFNLQNVVKEKPKFIFRVNQQMGGLLGHIWGRSDTETIMICLKTVFDIIQTVNEEKQKAPCVALAGLVQHIPSEFIEGATNSVISNPNIPDSNMELALDRMIMWLQWPNTRNIELWIVAFLRGLAATHKYTILINITEQSVEKVFDCLKYPVTRKSAFVVFKHMLLSFQHSPEAFHKIADRVPKLIDGLKQETSDDNTEMSAKDDSFSYLNKLVELLHCLMQLHPGFPDIYEPIMNCIKDFPKPSAESIQVQLTQNKWGARQQGERASSISKWLRKSETGKIGLLNLGNTCFMNSVIQVLFMCDSFRQHVLESLPGPSQLVLVKLRHVFAFLSASNRAFYSPSSFLHASKPPWFTAGHQQDCSEFLRYLLDLLHEQGIQKKRLEKNNSLQNELENGKKEKKGLFSSLKHSKDSKADKNAGHVESPEGEEPSLGERTFGGRLLNTYACLKCKHKSLKYEQFNDIALPFPEDAVKSNPRRSERKIAAASVSAGGDRPGNGSSSNQNKDGSKPKDNSGATEALLLQDLLANYLQPEKLEGDNKYHCDKCKSLQDAERTMKITHSPDYLILTLLRFSYDVKLQSRSKIFTEVKYPKTLYVPVNEVVPSPQVSPTATTKKSRKKSPTLSSRQSPAAMQNSTVQVLGSENMEVYGLSGVIVHSGLSSDGGHYYCYARHSSTIDEAQNEILNSNNVNIGDVDYLQDKWYLFNDSRVTYSSYLSFSDITQKFAKDTAYVLVYKKIVAGDIKTVDPNTSIHTAVLDPPLRRDLREAVDRDNKLYIQEQEFEERRRLASKKKESEAWFKRDNDDQGPPGSCGGGGGFGVHQGPSFVF